MKEQPDAKDIKFFVDDHEVKRQILDAIITGQIVDDILDPEKLINEGNNGVITLLDLSSKSPEFLNLIKELNPNFDINSEKLANKVLKVYNKGQGHREAMMQKRASTEGPLSVEICQTARFSSNCISVTRVSKRIYGRKSNRSATWFK